jgi:hypothetical protein
MSHTSIGETVPQEWGEFLHISSRTFTDFEEIRKEIVRDTDLKTGHSKGNLIIIMRNPTSLIGGYI